MKKVDAIEVFVAAPSDVTDDEVGAVSAAAKIVEECFLAMERKISINVAHWRDVPAGLHAEGPQGRIEKHLHPYERDIVIAIFKKKFGQATSDEGWTPTEREVRLACAAWKRDGRPQVAMYLSKDRIPNSQDEAKQVGYILAFKEELGGHMLTEEFADRNDLVHNLIPVLFQCWHNNKNALSPAPISNNLTIRATADVVTLRATGAAEPVPSVSLEVDCLEAETAARECKITAWTALGATVTARLSEEGVACWLIPTSPGQPGVPPKPIMGRWVAINCIEFAGVQLTERRSRFSVEGIRISPAQSGIQSGGERVSLGFIVDLGDNSAMSVVEVGRVELTHRIAIDSNAVAPLADGGNGGSSTWLVGDRPFAVLVRFEELVSGTFRSQSDEGARLTAGSFGVLKRALCADNGTRFLVRLSGVPDGARVYASATDIDEKEPSLLVHGIRAVFTTTDTNGAGSIVRLALVDAARLIPIPGYGGSHQCVWECLSPLSARPQMFTFGIVIEPAIPGRSAITIAASLAPITCITGAGSGLPIPRFLADGAARTVEIEFPAQDA